MAGFIDRARSCFYDYLLKKCEPRLTSHNLSTCLTTRLAVHDAGLTPAHEWARVKRPPGSDRSVHFRFFRIAGKTIYRWSGSLDARVE